jgi:uncharacterized repeat protein (TIGR01451 family)
MFRKKTAISRGFFMMLILLVASMMLSAVSVQADTLYLQEGPALSGYKIYFAEANGEASRFDRSEIGLSRLGGVLWQLGAQLETLEWRTGIPADADLIVIAGATTQLTADQTARLWSYLESDGSLLILADPVIGTGSRQQGTPSNAPLFSLMWSDMGMRARDDAVVTEGETQGTALIEALTTTDVESGDPLTADVDGELGFFRARSIQIDSAVQTFQTTALIFAPSDYYGEVGFNDYLTTGEAAYNIGTDTARGPLTLAATSINPTTNTRIALIGDRDFATNAGGLQSSPSRSAAFLYPENVRFLVRTIAWLLDADTAAAAELSFPTPGPTATPTITPTPLVVNADLGLTVDVNTDTPEEGGAIIYTFTVVNNGPDFAGGVNVTIPVPEGMTFVSATANTRQGYDARNNSWNVGDLGAQATGTLSLVLIANEGTTGATITITGTVNASALTDPNTEDNTASVDVQVSAGDGS